MFVLGGDALVAEAEVRYHWWTIAPDQLLAETAATGLAGVYARLGPDGDQDLLAYDRPVG